MRHQGVPIRAPHCTLVCCARPQDLREQWDDFSKSEVEARNAWVAETQTRMQEMRDAMKAQLGALREEAFRRMDADR